MYLNVFNKRSMDGVIPTGLFPNFVVLSNPLVAFFVFGSKKSIGQNLTISSCNSSRNPRQNSRGNWNYGCCVKSEFPVYITFCYEWVAFCETNSSYESERQNLWKHSQFPYTPRKRTMVWKSPVSLSKFVVIYF